MKLNCILKVFLILQKIVKKIQKTVKSLSYLSKNKKLNFVKKVPKIVPKNSKFCDIYSQNSHFKKPVKFYFWLSIG